MLKQMLIGALAVLTVATAVAENRFTAGTDGILNIDGLTFRISHWDPAWAMTVQSRDSLRFSGEADGGNVRNGLFKVKGGEFKLTETLDLSAPDRARVELKLSHPDGIPTNSLVLTASLPLKLFADRPILFNGKNVSFGAEFNEKASQARTGGNGNPCEVILPLKTGKLVISGNFTALLQDNRRFDSPQWELRLDFSPAAGQIKNAEFSAEFVYHPYRATPVNLRSAANMAFKDEVEGDRAGGWTDQGPDNDLAAMPVGKQKLTGLEFDVIDPVVNDDRSCIVLKGAERPYFPESAVVQLNGAVGRCLYLLNAIAWEPAAGTRIGSLTVTYSDGTSQTTPVISGVDTANFWMPRPIPNATVAWRNKNDSAGIGLYASRFRLEAKPIRSVTFQSSGAAVWMIVAATLFDGEIVPEAGGPVVMQANPDWVPIKNARDIIPGSVLDFSFLLDKPAGKYGFVQSVNGEFQFEGRPGKAARFFGANIAFSANFMEKKYADRMTDEFAATGYNLIRLHHYDHSVVARKNGASTSLDPAMIDRLDYLIAACKERGIYVTLDLFVNRRLEKGEIPEYPEREIGFQEFKALAFVNENAMKNFETFSANLMNHRNPYTGIEWKNEPAIVTISLINEDTLSGTWKRNDFIRGIYEREFEEYAKKNRLAPNDGNRRKLFEQFLNETYSRGYRRMAAFLRSIGVKTLLTDQNCVNDIATTVLRDQHDFVDNHFYWGHPQFLGKDWCLPAAVDASSATGSYAGGISAMFHSRIFGKPFTITEWDYVNPNPFNVEGSFLTGAYAALQNYGGLCRFAYSHSRDKVVNDNSPIEFFDVANDPLRLLSERAGTLFFLRGDVKTSEVSFPYLLNRNYLDIPEQPTYHPLAVSRLGLIGKTGTTFSISGAPADTRVMLSSVPAGKGPFPILLYDTSCNEMLKRLLDGKFISPANYDPIAQRFTSSTGELEIIRKTKTFRAVTPRSEGFIVPAETELAGTFANVRNGNTFSAILVAAIDEQPLRFSKRILILHLTDVKNTGMRFTDPEMAVVESYGTLPQLMRRGKAEITLAARPGMKLYACGFNGERKFEVKTVPDKNGTIRFTAENITDQGAIAVYELIGE